MFYAEAGGNSQFYSTASALSMKHNKTKNQIRDFHKTRHSAVLLSTCATADKTKALNKNTHVPSKNLQNTLSLKG